MEVVEIELQSDVVKSFKNESEVSYDDYDLCVPRKKPKPKVTCIWPPEDVRQLIISVESQKCLWDFGSAEHKCFVRREAAWKIVEKSLGFRYGIAECKAKWTNVKTAYQKCKAKMKASNSDLPPSWTYWIEMQFMNRSTSSANNSVSASNLSFDEMESSSNQFETVYEKPPSSRFIKNNSPPKRKRKYIAKSSPAPSLTSETVEPALDPTTIYDQDEWQILGNYLAEQMRNVALKNRQEADRLHRKLVRTVLDKLDELDDLPQS